MNDNIRLNKFLSLSGICSRRQADKMISKGLVTIDGQTAAVGMTVNADSVVLAEGRPVKNNLGTKVFLFNKPKGVACTESDEHAESKINDFLDLPYRVFSVGRLDKESSGLILLTNDGALSHRITSAASGCEKEYIVTLNKPVTKDILQKMSEGVYLEDLDKTTLPCIAEQIGQRRIRMVLRQGLNRQIRRMCRAFDLNVEKLKRVRVGNLELGALPPGQLRQLDDSEIDLFCLFFKDKVNGLD